MGATRTPSRNGNSPHPARPQTGERGVTGGASSYLGESLFRYGARQKPTAAQLAAMVDFDPWAEAIEGALTWPIISAGYSIVEADGDTGEAELVREQFEPIASKTIAGTFSAVGTRVSYAEPVWEYVDGTTVLTDLAFRPVEQCEMHRDANGRPAGFRQRSYMHGRGFVNEVFERRNSKAFVFLHGANKRPGVGRSALESAYQFHVDKFKLLFYRYKSLEKYGGPSTVGKTDAKEGTEEYDSFVQAVQDARAGASVISGLDDIIEYLNPPNAGDAFSAAIRDLNFEMAVSAFVQWLALAQEGNSGAYELSRDHSDFLTIVTEGRMEEGAEALTNGPIHDIVFHNRGPSAAFPHLEFHPISEHISKRMVEGAQLLFQKNGRKMPDWLAEGIAEGYGGALDIERPEDADPVGDAPSRIIERERPADDDESKPGGEEEGTE